MARKRTTIVRTQASVLDWFSEAQLVTFEAGSSTADYSAAIQTALSDVGSYELVFEPGTYGVGSQIVSAGSRQIRGNGATLLALGNIDTTGDGRGALLSFNAFVPTIEGLAFNLGSFNANAIYAASCNRPLFSRLSVTGIKAGYAGIRGGSMLYGEVSRSYFTGAGRSLDFQKGWELRSPMTGSPTLTFVSAGVGLGGTITRSSGSWITDGYAASDVVRIELSASNNSEFTINSRTATVLTLTAGTLVNEGPTAGCVVSKVSGSYYGFHDSVIEKCVFVANEGLRTTGYAKLRDNDHEHGVWQPATRNEDPTITGAPLCGAVVCGEEISRSDHSGHLFEFVGMYAELSVGTVNKQRAIAMNNLSGLAMSGGLLYGSVGPAAGSTCFYNVMTSNFSSTGATCLVSRWENAFEGQYQGSGGHNTIQDLSRVCGANVTNVFKAGTGVQPDEGSRSAGTWTDVCYTKEVGLGMAPNIRHVIQTITPSKAPANLNFANTRKYHLSGTGTLDTDYFVTITGGGFPIGADLELTFAAGSTWTIDSTSGKSLKLVLGVNRLFLAGESLLLIVDAAGAIREKGHA